MKALLMLLVAAAVTAGCAASPALTASPAQIASPTPIESGASTPSSPAVRCVGVSEAEPNVCAKMLATIHDSHPHEFDEASRIVIVDLCPEQVLCDRFYLYDAVAVIVPADGGIANALSLRVFGHQGQPFGIEAWPGRLPDHVAAVLAQG